MNDGRMGPISIFTEVLVVATLVLIIGIGLWYAVGKPPPGSKLIAATKLDAIVGLMADVSDTNPTQEMIELAKAISSLSATDFEVQALISLAWQESDFTLKVGRHGERGYYQVLPATVRHFYKLDVAGTKDLLLRVENDPWIATSVALTMLRTYRWNWKKWNKGLGYEYRIQRKMTIVKNTLGGGYALRY